MRLSLTLSTLCTVDLARSDRERELFESNVAKRVVLTGVVDHEIETKEQKVVKAGSSIHRVEPQTHRKRQN